MNIATRSLAAQLVELADQLVERADAAEAAVADVQPFMLAQKGADPHVNGEAIVDFIMQVERLRTAATQRIASLSRREYDVLREIASGAQNKEAGIRLGISGRTVEIHRANMLKRLRVSSVAEAVQLWAYTQLPVIGHDSELDHLTREP